jgi:hypothetical protein
MNTQQSIYNKLFKEESTQLTSHKVELGLMDDLKKEADKVSKQIGFVNKDIIEVKKAISLIGMVKADFASNDKLANDFLKAIVTFENGARDLGLEVPKQIIDYGFLSRELIKSNNELKKFVEQF